MESKKHFLTLDSLRGVAALAVVIFHFFEFVFPNLPDNPIGHSYLAVDFFFCLSGFVIAFAYDDRAEKMNVIQFLKNRLIRLHPMVMWGSIIGLIAYLTDPFANYSKVFSINYTGIPFFQSIFLIPTSIEVPNRYGNIFPFNPPAWSLFMEYVANVAFIMILWKIPKKGLLLLLTLAAIALGIVAQNSGYVIGGWNYITLHEGLARVGFSFLAGLTLKRLNLNIPNKLGFFGLSAILILVFAFPYLENNWIIELLIVVVVFPLIVLLGSGNINDEKFKPLTQFLGRMSYPLYMCHYWLISMFGNYYAKHQPEGLELFLTITFGLFIIIGFSYLSMRFIDEPLRKWLSIKFKK